MPRHPHILLAKDPAPGVHGVAELRATVARPGRAQRLWQGIRADATADLAAEPLTAFTPLPNRSLADVGRGNREYVIVDAAGQRIVKAALAAQLTEEADAAAAFAAAALAQIECLFDPAAWPEWQDIFHREAHGLDADLRTGQLSRDVGLAYDWLHDLWSPTERGRVLEGLDRCGVQPYLRAVDAGAWWVPRMNNWTTVIVGGLGICGMALGADHPQAARLVEMSQPILTAYMDHYGPDGEFNENPAYANSSFQPVLYFSALRSLRRASAPSPQIAALRRHCYWCLYASAPPGEMVSFGDGGPGYPALTSFVGAVAGATEDPVLQWYYERYGEPARFPVWELLWYRPDLPGQAPTPATLPLARAYDAHSGLISSRADWNPHTTPSLVFGKAGHGGVNHTHPDGGQIEIHGHGQRLIVDLGSVPYPARDAQRYYHFSSDGHNQITVGGRPQRWTRDGAHRARRTAFEADSERGAWWRIDLRQLHEGVTVVTRTVVHLLPGLVAVLDEAHLKGAEAVRLRWHPVTPPTLDAAGRYAVVSEGVRLRALVLQAATGLADDDPQRAPGLVPAVLTPGRHEYQAPYDTDRIGNPMPQRREPYLDATVLGVRATFLSLFAIGSTDDDPGAWVAADDGAVCGPWHVHLDAAALTATGPRGAWVVPRA